MHCDFKPANVFLTDTAEVKVIDFGIARVFQRPEEETDATIFDPGSLGALTPAYASPEMLEHREPDPRDDIYALGCITYELLDRPASVRSVPATQARNAGLKPQRPDNLGTRQWRALRGGAFVRARNAHADCRAVPRRIRASARARRRSRRRVGIRWSAPRRVVAAVVAARRILLYDQSKSDQEGGKGAQENRCRRRL